MPNKQPVAKNSNLLGLKITKNSLGAAFEMAQLARQPYLWFTNAAIETCFGSMVYKYENAQNQDGKNSAFAETEAALAFYWFLVYTAYPKSEKFRNAVDSSSETSENFHSFKNWMDSSGGKKNPKEFLSLIAKRVKSQ